MIIFDYLLQNYKQTRVKGPLFNMTKVILRNPRAKIIFDGKIEKYFFWKQEQDRIFTLITELEILAGSNKKRKWSVRILKKNYAVLNNIQITKESSDKYLEMIKVCHYNWL